MSQRPRNRTISIPFVPEDYARLRLRYDLAIDHVHHYPAMVAGHEPNPTTERAHIFDCYDGIRLIVSRERSARGQHFLMISATLEIGSAVELSLDRENEGKRIEADRFVDLAETAFRAISREARPMKFLGYDQGAIWAISEEDSGLRTEDSGRRTED
jgi:hypothetical protein